MNSLSVGEALRQFLLAGRGNSIMIVLHETDRLERECPRMLALLRHFSTAVKINETLEPAELAAYATVASLILNLDATVTKE